MVGIFISANRFFENVVNVAGKFASLTKEEIVSSSIKNGTNYEQTVHHVASSKDPNDLNSIKAQEQNLFPYVVAAQLDKTSNEINNQPSVLNGFAGVNVTAQKIHELKGDGKVVTNTPIVVDPESLKIAVNDLVAKADGVRINNNFAGAKQPEGPGGHEQGA